MKIGAMLEDIVGSLFKKPVTEMYPFERKPTPPNLRGRVIYDAEKCIGCGFCVKECPANALELFIIDRASRKFVMKYNLNRCIYCNQCNIVCRPKCIGLSSEHWELASLTKEPFIEYMGKKENVESLLARPAEEVPGEA